MTQVEIAQEVRLVFTWRSILFSFLFHHKPHDLHWSVSPTGKTELLFCFLTSKCIVMWRQSGLLCLRLIVCQLPFCTHPPLWLAMITSLICHVICRSAASGSTSADTWAMYSNLDWSRRSGETGAIQERGRTFLFKFNLTGLSQTLTMFSDQGSETQVKWTYR